MTLVELRTWAHEHSDGCTGVADVYVEACWAHDYAYQTGCCPWTERRITRAQADRLLRREIQKRSRFGVWSPMSWWRWAGVRMFARSAWQGQ